MAKSSVTKWRLAASFEELLERMPYGQITVSAVARNCGMSRQSFYYHFHSLSDLLNWTGQKRLEAILSETRGDGDWSYMLVILESLYQRSDVLLKTMDDEARAVFDRFIRDNLGVVALRLLGDYPQWSELALADRSLIVRFYVTGMVEIIWAWFDDGMRERPEELAGRMEALFAGGVAGSMRALRGLRGPEPGREGARDG